MGRRKKEMNGGYPASYRLGEKTFGQPLPTTPTSTAPGPQTMPVEGFVGALGAGPGAGGYGGRGAEFGAGQAAAQDVSGESMGPRLSIIPSDKVPSQFQGDPRPGGFEGWGHTPGKLMHAAIHRPE